MFYYWNYPDIKFQIYSDHKTDKGNNVFLYLKLKGNSIIVYGTMCWFVISFCVGPRRSGAEEEICWGAVGGEVGEDWTDGVLHDRRRS